MTPAVRAGRQVSASTPLFGLLAVGAFLAILLLTPTPARAHPFGEPQTARLSADGSQVTLRWSAPSDDLVLLGGAVGALPNRRTLVFPPSPDAEPEPLGSSDAELIAKSPEVIAYLKEHLAVRQDGRNCPGEVSLDNLAEDGAVVAFTCRHPVEEVEVEIAMLTDFHAAYRTAAIGEGSVPGRSLYTIDETVQTWSFSRSNGELRGGIDMSSWALGGVLSALLPVAWLWRRNRAASP